jgi:multiple sugar transport system ATP-binding protein
VSAALPKARPDDAQLCLDGVSKTFAGGVQAVAGVSLSVGPRELLVLVGPSGCGKSTLLRLVAGLEEPDAGRITLAGRDLAGVSPAQRDVALVFQSHALYPAKTVYENLAFALRLRRTPRAEIDQRVRAIAGRLGLEAVLDVRPGQLSGGQQQRVALGRALVRRPALFLLDEPLSDLDAGLRRDLRRLIKQVQRELARPTIYVTHDQEEATALADCLVVMNAGRILQAGTPQEVYNRPACRFVAGFLGSPPMNFLKGRLVPGEGQLLFTWANEERSLTAGWLQCHVGQPVVLGVRPEALSVAPTGPESLQFSGPVLLAEPAGDRVDVTLRVGETGLTARLEARQAPAEGDQLTLFCLPGACHWFRPGAEGKSLLPETDG